MPKTIAFLGATGGCGLATLTRSLTASHACQALCRTPSKLTTAISTTYPDTPTGTLSIVEGNALDESAISKVVVHPSDPARLVDVVIFSIGSTFNAKKLANDFPTVCEDAMRAFISALDAFVDRTGAPYPHVVAVSSTGISAQGRDYPLMLAPLYKGLLESAHADKRKMEAVVKGGKATGWTVIRPTLLKDGVSPPEKRIRAGVEDLVAGRLERKELGYTITRDDVGKWIFENFVDGEGGKFSGKAVSLTT